MSIKILLADDSVTIQKVVGIIFGSEEYALTVVDNGKAAVEKAREVNPDVMLIDALMPGMSGYEVCEAVRAIPELSSKPILLLTGSFEPFDENKAKTCGANDFLAKPFESQQMINKVKELYDAALAAPVAPAAVEAPAPAAQEIEFEAPAAAGNDIWDAFTASEPAAAPPLDDTAFELGAPDPEPAPAVEDGTGTKWIPVEEETFDFQEETSEPVVQSAAPSFAVPVEDSGAFEMELTPVQEQQVFSTSPAAEPEPVFTAPVVEAPVPEAAAPIAPVAAAILPAEMSEEQLRTAILGASREVIERIVWEVVPDLAEAMIKEAIRQIKEGTK